MYTITVKKIIFSKINGRTKKQLLNIETINNIDIINLPPKILELKKIYKDFNYIIDFNKI